MANPDLAAQAAEWLNLMLAAPHNLTALRTPDAALQKHLIEPLSGWRRLLAADLSVPHGLLIDVGSGNGAPGLPIALCAPLRPALLLDARQAAVRFLDAVVRDLGTEQISVRCERAETAGHGTLRERGAVALSRATAPPAAALELLVPLLQIGGVAVIWTGELPLEQRRMLAATARVLGAELASIDPPQDMLVAIKQRHTEPRYPRGWHQIRRGPPVGDRSKPQSVS